MKKSKKNRIVEKGSLQKKIGFKSEKAKAFFNNTNAILEEIHHQKKYSEIFYEFMKPAIEGFIDEEMSLKRMLDLGQTIWNKGVAEDFPDHPNCSQIEIWFSSFFILNRDNRIFPLLLDRKRELFGGEKFFIAEQSALLNEDGNMVITVSIEPVEDNHEPVEDNHLK